jgi:hypothetical protein
MVTPAAGFGDLTVSQLTVKGNPVWSEASSDLHGTTYVWDQGLQVGQIGGYPVPLCVYGATTLYGSLTVG